MIITRTLSVEKMSLANSRRQSNSYTITAPAAEQVSLPTPRAPIHDDIPIAPGGDKASRPNPGELRHGSIMKHLVDRKCHRQIPEHTTTEVLTANIVYKRSLKEAQLRSGVYIPICTLIQLISQS
jgi:hypothetical protein